MGFSEEEEGKKSKKMMACGRGWRRRTLATGIRRRRAEVRKRESREISGERGRDGSRLYEKEGGRVCLVE